MNRVISKLAGRMYCEMSNAFGHISAGTAVFEEDEPNKDGVSLVP